MYAFAITHALRMHHSKDVSSLHLSNDAAAGKDCRGRVCLHSPVCGVLKHHIRPAIACGLQINERPHLRSPLAALGKAMRCLHKHSKQMPVKQHQLNGTVICSGHSHVMPPEKPHQAQQEAAKIPIIKFYIRRLQSCI